MAEWDSFLQALTTKPPLSSASAMQSYALFETFVIQVLQAIADAEKKTLEISSPHMRVFFDAFAPEGLENFHGPLAIEIKLFRETRLARFRLRDILARLAPKLRERNCRSFLLIIGGRLDEAERAATAAYAEEYIPGVSFHIWDSNELKLRIDKYSERLAAVIPKLPSIAVENVVLRSAQATPEEWKKERRQQLENLKRAYQQNDLVLVLGAGVSMSAGIPDWDTLLSRLLVAMIEENLPSDVNSSKEERIAIATKLRELQGSSALLEARYVRTGIKESFEKIVAQALYLESEKRSAKTSPLLRALARLCLPRRSGSGLRAVVTYNFDDLLETLLSELGVLHRSIYRDGDFADQDELSIYHVHGFLPRNIDKYDHLSQSLLVFSEEKYHRLMLDPYSWANLVQLSAFRERTCLFVGLSMTDPNLRRLLDISAKSNSSARHFAILKRLDAEQFAPKKKKVRKDVVRAFASAHYGLQQSSLKELGVNVLWVEDHTEVPRLIDELTNRKKDASTRA